MVANDDGDRIFTPQPGAGRGCALKACNGWRHPMATPETPDAPDYVVCLHRYCRELPAQTIVVGHLVQAMGDVHFHVNENPDHPDGAAFYRSAFLTLGMRHLIGTVSLIKVHAFQRRIQTPFVVANDPGSAAPAAKPR